MPKTDSGHNNLIEGYISYDVGFPDVGEAGGSSSGSGDGGDIGEVFGSIGNVIGTIISLGLELAPIVLQMTGAISAGNVKALEYLKPQFDTKIKQLDNQVKLMNKNINIKAGKLATIKDQTEYSKIYKPLVKEYKAYQDTVNFVNRIKAHSNSGDYQSVANELENFTNNNQRQIISDSLQPNVKLQNNISNYSYKMPNTPNSITLNEQLINIAGKTISPHLKIAGSNLQNAMQNFKYATNNPHAHILDSRVQITNQNLNKLMDDVRIPKNSRGVIYDNNSEQSKLLWQSPEIQDFVRTNFENLIIDKTPKTYDIEFVIKQNFEGADNFAGLQHCKLFNPQITPDGYFKGIIVDYYDFEYRPLIGTPKEIAQNYINNWGFSMQEKNYLEKQFNIYIIFEKLW